MTYSNVLFRPAVDLHRVGKKLEKKNNNQKDTHRNICQAGIFSFSYFLNYLNWFTTNRLIFAALLEIPRFNAFF